jgi:hypothetical protein
MMSSTEDSCHPLEALTCGGGECCISNNGNTLYVSWSARPTSRQSTACGNIRVMLQHRKYEPQYSWQLGNSVETTLEPIAVARMPLKWHSCAQNMSLCPTLLLYTTGYSVAGKDSMRAGITGSSQTDIQGQSYAGLELHEVLGFMTRRSL